MARFAERFEALAALLYEASHYGPNAGHERRYGELRGWMLAHYSAIRSFLTPYLADDHRDRSVGDVNDFECLFSSPTLAELLRCDDGRMLARIHRAQEALGCYGRFLATLIEVG